MRIRVRCFRNGPIVGPVDGIFHMYVPLYGNYTGIKSLFRVEYIMHGIAEQITGPYDWSARPTIPGGINPAFLYYNDSVTGKTVYTLWNGGVRSADSPDGPWVKVPGRNPCGANPAPAHHKGVFYCTSQHTTEIFSAPKISVAFISESFAAWLHHVFEFESAGVFARHAWVMQR